MLSYCAFTSGLLVAFLLMRMFPAIGGHDVPKSPPSPSSTTSLINSRMIHKSRKVVTNAMQRQFSTLVAQGTTGGKPVLKRVVRRYLQEGDPALDVCIVFNNSDALGIMADSGLHCSCAGNSPEDGLYTLHCDMLKAECKDFGGDKACSKVTLDTVYNGFFRLINFSSCVTEYSVNDVPRDDFCMKWFFCPIDESNPSDVTFCNCSVSVANLECNRCSPCANGYGIEVDCTNYREDAVTECSSPGYNFDPTSSEFETYYPDFGKSIETSGSVSNGEPTNQSTNEPTTLSDTGQTHPNGGGESDSGVYSEGSITRSYCTMIMVLAIASISF